MRLALVIEPDLKERSDGLESAVAWILGGLGGPVVTPVSERHAFVMIAAVMPEAPKAKRKLSKAGKAAIVRWAATKAEGARSKPAEKKVVVRESTAKNAAKAPTQTVATEAAGQ